MSRSSSSSSSGSPVLLTKTITINTINLTKDIDLHLAFVDPNSKELFKTQYPIAWKVAHLTGGLGNSFTVNFSTQYGVGGSQFDVPDVGVIPLTWQNVEQDQVCSVSFRNSRYSLTMATLPKKSPIGVYNNTGFPTSFLFGFNYRGVFNPVVCAPLENTRSTSFDFFPVLNAWVNLKYSQNQMISEPIVEEPLLGKGINLLSLSYNSTFILRENPDGGYDLRNEEST